MLRARGDPRPPDRAAIAIFTPRTKFMISSAVYAMAVNEENASAARVGLAADNGARASSRRCSAYYRDHCEARTQRASETSCYRDGGVSRCSK